MSGGGTASTLATADPTSGAPPAVRATTRSSPGPAAAELVVKTVRPAVDSKPAAIVVHAEPTRRCSTVVRPGRAGENVPVTTYAVPWTAVAGAEIDADCGIWLIHLDDVTCVRRTPPLPRPPGA